VTDFDVIDNLLILLIDETTIAIYNQDVLVFKETFPETFKNIIAISSIFFIVMKRNNTFLSLRKENDSFTILDEFNGVNLADVSREQKIFRSKVRSENGDALANFIDLESREVLWSSPEISAASFIDDLVFSREYELLVIYRMRNGEKISAINLDNHSKSFKRTDGQECKDTLMHLITIRDGLIWLSMSSGRILAFDIDQGTLTHEIGLTETDLTGFRYVVRPGDYIPFSEYLQLECGRERLITLSGTDFIHLDLAQSDLKRRYIDVSQSMNLHGLASNFRKKVLPEDNDFIYFCDGQDGKLGIFEKKSMNVIWSYKLNIRNEGITQILEMKLAQNRWLVLDRHHTLHILEA
jgi:hypothetical protein